MSADLDTATDGRTGVPVFKKSKTKTETKAKTDHCWVFFFFFLYSCPVFKKDTHSLSFLLKDNSLKNPSPFCFSPDVSRLTRVSIEGGWGRKVGRSVEGP